MITDRIVTELSKLPNYLDGKQCVTEMKNAGDKNPNQMYWHGWYFQFWCRVRFRNIMIVPSPIKYKDGKVQFDAYFNSDIDFKAHDESEKNIPLNDTQAILEAITIVGKVRFIIALGKLVPDIDGSFKRWHKNFIGKESKYVQERKQRGAKSRSRFKAFEISRIVMLDLDKESYKKTKSFQEGFRNSNGNPRNQKLSINLADFQDEIVELVTFGDSKPKIKHNLDQFI